MKIPSVSKLIDNAFGTFRRFPFVIISAVIASIVMIRIVNFNIESSFEFHPVLFKIVMASSLGIPFLFAIRMLGESIKLNLIRTYILQIFGIIILALYYFTISDNGSVYDIGRYFLYSIAFHLLASFSAFIISRDYSLLHFWDFNQKIFLRFILSALYSGVLYLGLAVALLAFDNLFEIHIQGKRYFQLFIFIAGIFNTWFFCSGVPDLESIKKSIFVFPKGLKIFTQYVLLPIIVIYILILYLYLVKILFSWQLPMGWVSYLVIGFSTAGIFSLLLIYPEKNNIKWVNIFSKVFFITLIPHIILLFVAIMRRTNEYGITERRYYVIVLSIWLSLMTITYIATGFNNIKIIPITLFVIALITSSGPWSAFNMSLNSQLDRFEEILIKNSILVNNKVTAVKKEITDEERKDIYSIINFLIDRNKISEAQKWFNEDLEKTILEKKEQKYRSKADKIVTLMGIEPNPEKDFKERKSFTLQAEENGLWNVGNYNVLINFNYNKSIPDTYQINKNGLEIKFSSDTVSNNFNVYLKNDTLKFNFDTLIYKSEKEILPTEKLNFETKTGRLLIKNLSVMKSDSLILFNSISGDLFLK